MAISALKWREKNGSIILYADEICRSYLKKIGVLNLYDEVRNLDIDKNIRADIFWAAGKLCAMKDLDKPAVIIDTDLIVWEDIREELIGEKVSAMHIEPILFQTYKPPEYFNLKRGYEFDPDWDWSIPPSNTALLYIEDMQFKEYYLKSAANFIENIEDTKDTLSYMVFAEQRLLSMCAKKMNIAIKYMLKFPEAVGNQSTFTHLWGYKGMMDQSDPVRKRFVDRLKNRLLTDFNERAKIIETIEKSEKVLK